MKNSSLTVPALAFLSLLFAADPRVAHGFEARILERVEFPAEQAPDLGWKSALSHRSDGSLLVSGFGYGGRSYPVWLVSSDGRRVIPYNISVSGIVLALDDGSSILLVDQNGPCSGYGLVRIDAAGKMGPFSNEPLLCSAEINDVTYHDGKVFVNTTINADPVLLRFDLQGKLEARFNPIDPFSDHPVTGAAPHFFKNGSAILATYDGFAIFDRSFRFLFAPVRKAYGPDMPILETTEMDQALEVEKNGGNDSLTAMTFDSRGNPLDHLLIPESSTSGEQLSDNYFELDGFGAGFFLSPRQVSEDFFRVDDQGKIAKVCSFGKDATGSDAFTLWEQKAALKNQVLALELGADETEGDIAFFDLKNCLVKQRLLLPSSEARPAQDPMFQPDEKFLIASGYGVFLVGVKD